MASPNTNGPLEGGDDGDVPRSAPHPTIMQRAQQLAADLFMTQVGRAREITNDFASEAVAMDWPIMTDDDSDDESVEKKDDPDQPEESEEEILQRKKSLSEKQELEEEERQENEEQISPSPDAVEYKQPFELLCKTPKTDIKPEESSASTTENVNFHPLQNSSADVVAGHYELRLLRNRLTRLEIDSDCSEKTNTISAPAIERFRPKSA